MDFIVIIDALALFGFATSGSVIAAKKGMDWFGISFMGFITALGGGTVRDILLDLQPLWLSQSEVLIFIGLGIGLTILRYKWTLRMHRTLALFDTLGISLASISGTARALENGADTIPAMLLGIVSACLGGILRDTFCNEVPMVFKRELYATACFTGSGFLIVWLYFTQDQVLGYWIGIGTVFSIRMLAIFFKIGLPRVQSAIE